MAFEPRLAEEDAVAEVVALDWMKVRVPRTPRLALQLRRHVDPDLIMGPREPSTAEITAQLRALGVAEGDVLLVHTSFRAIRPIEGGPQGLIAALRDALGPKGTLVMPSWTGSDEEPFDAATTPASSDLGVVADTFWRLPGVLRSRALLCVGGMRA